ncbi:MAG: iron-molybdenum cofactor biosynthesis protein [Actinobacteria bacterium]|nr:iron-molybdenum cofactor biosynthesis protein [Actinomycetota bacterium]
MKIAIASNDGVSVGRHFGRVRGFVVLTVEDGAVTGREERPSPRANGGGRGEHGHADCFEVAGVIGDCEALVAGGMGRGAYGRFTEAGIETILTDERSVEEAAARYAAGDLPHVERLLHRGRGGHDHDHDHDDD